MFFGFQLTLGLMMVFYGYSVMKNPRVWGDQGHRAVKAEHFSPLVKWCRENEGFSWPWPHVQSEKKRIKELRREQESQEKAEQDSDKK